MARIFRDELSDEIRERLGAVVKYFERLQSGEEVHVPHHAPNSNQPTAPNGNGGGATGTDNNSGAAGGGTHGAGHHNPYSTLLSPLGLRKRSLGAPDRQQEREDAKLLGKPKPKRRVCKNGLLLPESPFDDYWYCQRCSRSSLWTARD